MNVTQTKIDGPLIIEPRVFGDRRGFFIETYNVNRYKEIGIDVDFMQDNLSASVKGVLRGLHFQKPPFAQGKLVQVIKGAVLDVAVDIRTGSDTYGQWESVLLTEKNKKQFWIPEGFAHGFVALEDDTIFSYKCTNVYAPECDGGIMWNDPMVNVDWQLEKYGIKEPIISEKDKKNIAFKELDAIFYT
ncbi:MAG: dTDP-4-dehydrorhamnose 3,5-epimerase [Candidatus Moraniibacteriota bacterium]|nr:MAG: dTDP-4-dehydrorhamnose 3,5-epimerase [Candidatus Moranbacteria bacterium]